MLAALMAHRGRRMVCALMGARGACRFLSGSPTLLIPQRTLIPRHSTRPSEHTTAAVPAAVTTAHTRTPHLSKHGGQRFYHNATVCTAGKRQQQQQQQQQRQHHLLLHHQRPSHPHRCADRGIACSAAACQQPPCLLTTVLEHSAPPHKPRAALLQASRRMATARHPASSASDGGSDGRKHRVSALKMELAQLSPTDAVKHVIEAAHFGRKVLRVHWHVALEACGRVGFYKPAERVLEAMLEHGVKPNAYSYRVLIHCYGVAQQLEGVMRACEELRAIQCQKEKGRLTAKDYNTLLEAISRCGALAEFEQVYAQMKQDGVQPDDKTLVSAMTCYSKAGREEELNAAFEQYVARQKAGCKPMSPYVFNTYMTHFSRAGNTEKCRDILHMWRANSEDPNWYLINGYMAAHAVNGECDACRAIFESEFVGEGEAEVTPSVLNTLMHSYVRAGRTEDARSVLALFDDFRLRPQATTFMLLLQAVAEKGNVAAARALMKHMEQARITVGARAYAMLLRAMYVRGDPPQALEAEFDAMMQRNAKPLPLAFESLYLAYDRMKDSAGCETTLRRMRLLDVAVTPAMQAVIGIAEGPPATHTSADDAA